MPRFLNVNVSAGGSGTGISYWKNWYECGERAMRDEEARATGRTSSSDNDETALGTAWHGFLRIYFEGGLRRQGYDTSLVRFRQTNARPWRISEKALTKAEDLFRLYRAKFQPNYYGKVLHVEKRYKMQQNGKAPLWLPAAMELTCQIDLVVHMGKKAIHRIAQDFHLDLEPGVYLIDHKTLGNPMYMSQYQYEPQFPVYNLIWDHKHPGQKAKGFLINVALKSANQFRLVWLPPVDEHKTQIVKKILQRASYNKMWPEPDPMRCFDYGRECPYGASGECRRY